jgi:hypothetical protein
MISVNAVSPRPLAAESAGETIVKTSHHTTETTSAETSFIKSGEEDQSKIGPKEKQGRNQSWTCNMTDRRKQSIRLGFESRNQ